MEARDDMAPFRNSPFQEPLSIGSRHGEPGEEHIRTTMDIDQELTMAVTVQEQQEDFD